MTEPVILEEIILEDAPLGLADKLTESDIPFKVIINSDEKAEADAEVFFGITLPIGDIAEVKGKIISCNRLDNDTYEISIEILALDSRYTDLLTRILSGKIPSDDSGPVWGVGLKQTNGAFATIVNCPGGLLNAEQLAKISEITKKGAGVAKLTHAQRVVLLLNPEQLETIQNELESVGLNIGILHRGIRNIRACCGTLCSMSQGLDGLSLSLKINQALFGRAAKFDVKISISDCNRNCLESFCVDIGLLGNNGAYDIYVGGVGSSVHFKGLRLTTGVSPEESISLMKNILQWYENTAEEGERLYKTLERLGQKEIKTDNRLFAEAGAVFEKMNIGEDISSRLERTLARSYGLLKMRKDLKIEL